MEQISDTESEPEQFPTEPVVEEQSLEKPKKRVYKKKVKLVEPEAVEEPVKPKRVMTEEHKEKMRVAREASKARKALALSKPEPITRQETEEPKAEPEVKPKRKYTRKPKAEVAEVAEPKVIVKEIHHHYAEPKAKKVKDDEVKAPRKPRVKKEVQPKQIVQSVEFV
jgi:translation initiation factor IF-2|tara:strand:- start:559 stop:1059 length:501 start_codon:yes stop_codon:yes gene_type:complete